MINFLIDMCYEIVHFCIPKFKIELKCEIEMILKGISNWCECGFSRAPNGRFPPKYIDNTF